MAQTTEEILREGHEASALLSSDTFRDAVQRVRDEIIAEWAGADGPDKLATREALHCKFVLLEDIVSALFAPIRKARAVVDDDVVI